ncbi:alpha-2-macroglobulin [Massilia sp. W12]|uniref:alpha-2-macroglobulin family protein n=1 Tax=Massilia sp. W12 TaxID=3126507 RepID=UPI0030CE30D4
MMNIKRLTQIFLLFLLCCSSVLQAAPKTLEPSYYNPANGGPFFLLTDASYGSSENALVRFETTDMYPLENYGGLDLRIYRVPKPLEFLKAQKNLHRIDVQPNPGSEGLGNASTYLWDSWFKKSRMAWQSLFSADSRKQVTKEEPRLQTPKNYGGASQFSHPNQFKPIPGLELQDSFRYPVHNAKTIAPPKDLKLEGSNSNLAAGNGNIMIPLGKRAPGLYVVEGMAGSHRAVTLLFVSDSIAVTKSAARQMLVWSVRRSSGAAVPGTQIVWTDGAGVLQSGVTDARGVADLQRDNPEKTYVFGQDAQGGVFISENFYYDSEIYDTKVYATTDRPLYRPGDTVFVKVFARQFLQAMQSKAATAGALELQVIDPNGMPVASQKLQLSSSDGVDSSLRLPDNAAVGGYELRMRYQDQLYLAAFRVAQYQKPHFEINLLAEKNGYKTGQAVRAKLQLRYPDGKPVANAKVQLSLRAQQLTMVEGDLTYSGQFPLKLKAEEYESDSKGMVELDLPPAKEPSRYIITAFASDGAAYRVKLSREILIERAANAYQMRASEQISQPQQNVRFTLQAQGAQQANGGKPQRWQAIKLENREKTEGRINGAQFDIAFAQSGSYTVSALDEEGNVLGATTHWVAGDGMQASPGTLEIVFNKDHFQPGETAQALITFPEEVSQALLTMERDKVEAVALMAQGEAWVRMQKIGARQYRAHIPVKAEYGPNMTFSVAYVKNGQFLFENAGLRVAIPKVDIALRYAKEVYQPGEKVTLEVQTSVAGKQVAANLSLGVVDEMIYVLQPEIAPDIFDFFYHPRRNNVRTSVSLNFVTYDLAISKNGEVPRRSEVNERNVKVLERPRRDEVDTAFWDGNLKTDANGRAAVSFTMPDSLTRWRITARAMNEAGVVGQKSSWLRSDKAFYVKWTSPDWMRQGDAPQAALALFNQTRQEQKLDLHINGAGFEKKQSVNLKPGINFHSVELASINRSQPLTMRLLQNGQSVDLFQTGFKLLPQAWRSPRAVSLSADAGEVALSLPPDAANVSVFFASNAQDQFARVMENLIEYPYGCVEQTASRLIPLTLALQSAAPQHAKIAPRLQQILHTQRLRLAQMAGPNAVFSWWGGQGEADPFVTTYAYYADWRAAQVLKLNLPEGHFSNLPKLYAEHGVKAPLQQQALMLWMMKEIGLPVEGVAANLAKSLQAKAGPAQASAQDSLLMGQGEGALQRALALGILSKVTPAASFGAEQSELLRKANLPLSQALLVWLRQAGPDAAEKLLAASSVQSPTIDRAISLVWLQQSMGNKLSESGAAAKLGAPWQAKTSNLGHTYYSLPEGQSLPAQLKIEGAKAGLVAQVQYDSSAAEASGLPLKFTRRIYRLESDKSKVEAPKPGQEKTGKQAASAPPPPSSEGASFRLVLLKPGTVLKTNELYLDEIELESGSAHQHVLAEIPLPPGAAVESSTWGINVRKENELQGLERARHQVLAAGYALPFEQLQGREVRRHLLRFSQPGKYRLPPARAWRMYQPEKKAYEAAVAWDKMDVQ